MLIERLLDHSLCCDDCLINSVKISTSQLWSQPIRASASLGHGCVADYIKTIKMFRFIDVSFSINRLDCHIAFWIWRLVSLLWMFIYKSVFRCVFYWCEKDNSNGIEVSRSLVLLDFKRLFVRIKFIRTSVPLILSTYIVHTTLICP